MSRDSVRLAFLIAALNGLQVLVADVTNGYLYKDVKEEILLEEDLEHGKGYWKICVLPKLVYGIKSSGNTCKHGLYRQKESLVSALARLKETFGCKRKKEKWNQILWNDFCLC